MNALIPIDESKCRLLNIGAQFAESLSREDWLAVGEHFNRIGGCLNWWLGDWMLYGVKEYGDKSAIAYEMAENLGLGAERLRSCLLCSELVKLATRVSSLSWSHHREVMGLTGQEQKKWLTLAAQEKWPVEELRRQMRANNADMREPNTGGDFVPLDWINKGIRGFKSIDVARLSSEQRMNLKQHLQPLHEIWEKL